MKPLMRERLQKTINALDNGEMKSYSNESAKAVLHARLEARRSKLNLPAQVQPMAIQWPDFALESLAEILIWYELEAGRPVADSVQNRIWQQVEKIDGFPMSIPASDLFPKTRKLVMTNLPCVAFIRQLDGAVGEVIVISISLRFSIGSTVASTCRSSWHDCFGHLLSRRHIPSASFARLNMVANQEIF